MPQPPRAPTPTIDLDLREPFATKVHPGSDTIVLFATVQGWEESPLERTFEIEWPAPKRWDRAALESLIRQVMKAGGEHADAFTRKPRTSEDFYYCHLHHGRARHEGTSKKRLFLLLVTPQNRYQVALPAFPTLAVAELLSDSNLIASLEFRLGSTAYDRGITGPAPRVRPAPKKARGK